ncbi:unnamed protein product [Caenorhabditis brenneri]
MTLKFWLGFGSFTLSLISIFLNFLIFFPVFRLAFVAKKSSVYIIAFYNVISDLLQLFVTCFYLSASIMADKYVITGDRLNQLAVIFGWVFINAWYMECLVQIVMAVNRFISDHTIMSFMFVNPNNSYSYSNLMLVSYDVFCTTTSTLAYISVFFSIRNSYKDVEQNSQSAQRSNKDVKYLLQFVFISVFYIFTWVLFEILPHIVPAGQVEWYSVVPVLVTLNCSSNSIIYLSVNREVQKSLPWASRKIFSTTSKVSTVGTTGNQTPVDN